MKSLNIEYIRLNNTPALGLGDIFLYLICKIFRPWSIGHALGFVMAKDKKDTKKVAITGTEMMKKYRGDPNNK